MNDIKDTWYINQFWYDKINIYNKQLTAYKKLNSRIEKIIKEFIKYFVDTRRIEIIYNNFGEFISLIDKYKNEEEINEEEINEEEIKKLYINEGGCVEEIKNAIVQLKLKNIDIELTEWNNKYAEFKRLDVNNTIRNLFNVKVKDFNNEINKLKLKIN